MISHVTEREQQMTAAIERRPIAEMSADESTTNRVIESVIVRGDISALTQQERAAYYLQICRSLGLNPAAQPLTPLRLNGKEILYASRGATDQLAAQHGINREIIDGPKVIDLAGTKLVYAVCRATHPSGRSETAVATVPLQDPANVLMKAETKAKRRATLSILGLGMLDETEIETIPAAAKSEAAPLHVDVTASESKPERRQPKLGDEEKAARVAAILADYDKAIAAGENAGAAYDTAYDTAKRAGRDSGVAVLVQKALNDRARAEAERKRAKYEAHQAIYDRLLGDLANAATPVQVVTACIENRDAVGDLPESWLPRAWAESVSRWSAVGGEDGGDGLQTAMYERGES